MVDHHCSYSLAIYWVYRIHREKLHFRTNPKAPPQNVPVLAGYNTQQYSNGEMSQYEIHYGGIILMTNYDCLLVISHSYGKKKVRFVR